MSAHQKIAYARIILPDGSQLRRQIVEFDAHHRPLRYEPLTEELPFVEWHDETYTFPSLQPEDDAQ